MGYDHPKKAINVQGTGSHGLDELREQFRDDDVQYAVLAVVIEGDTLSKTNDRFNPVKYLFVIWVRLEWGDGRDLPMRE